MKVSHIRKIYPTGTNSTMFTECCDVAICRDEKTCPLCKTPVIGYDAETDHARDRIRWRNATKNWNRSV